MSKSNQLVIFGYGGSAQAYISKYKDDFIKPFATSRSQIQDEAVTPLLFDAQARIDENNIPFFQSATHLLVSIAPYGAFDPVLAAAKPYFESLEHVVYLSTVGVYGDAQGQWIDENWPLEARTDRAKWRIQAEADWIEFCKSRNIKLTILRLAGIYGQKRNILLSLQKGKAKRIDKPEQVFNRIHEADIAQAIHLAFKHKKEDIFNLADDEPVQQRKVVEYAASLLNITPPPLKSWEEASRSMSEMAKSFYTANRRISNKKAKSELGLALVYPTYKEGLDALFNERSRL